MDQIDNQDGALENADAQDSAETQVATETATDLAAELEKARAEAAKWKRISDRNAKKSEAPKETPAPDDLVHKAYLAARGITDEDEVDLATSTATKWGLTLDKLMSDADWQDKIGKFRTQKANERATAEIKAGPGSASSTQTPEFYIARGTPPSAEEVTDSKTRAQITRAMMGSGKKGGRFYNRP